MFVWLFGVSFLRAMLLSTACPKVVVDEDDCEAMLSASLVLGAIAAGFAFVGPDEDPVADVLTDEVESADPAALRGRVLVLITGFFAHVAQWHTVIPNSNRDAFRSCRGMRHAPQ